MRSSPDYNLCGRLGSARLKELPAALILWPFGFNTLAIRAYELASDELLEQASIWALAIVAAGLIPVILLSLAIRKSRPGHSRNC